MRKFKFWYIVYIFLIVSGFFVFFWQQNIFAKKMIDVTSPLPNFLTFFLNNQVSTLSLWFPSSNKVNTQQEPYISARSSLLYDLTTNKTLFEKNSSERVPMASLTKIMTAMIAIESGIKEFRISNNDLIGEDSMGLSEGEILSLDELLYGLILHSGNDAAEALASNYPGGRDAFIKAMNNKARSLGLLNTHFTNPTGLEGDGKQYTTSFDLLVITREVLKYPLFAKITRTFDYNIPFTLSHKAFYLENETNLLTSYPGVLGVKTGYTPEAGLCLVTYLNYKGHDIVGILLGSENRRQEMKDLLDYGLEVQGIPPPQHE